MSESIVKLERAWSESVDPGSVLSLRYISLKPIKAILGPTLGSCKKIFVLQDKLSELRAQKPSTHKPGTLSPIVPEAQKI